MYEEYITREGGKVTFKLVSKNDINIYELFETLKQKKVTRLVLYYTQIGPEKAKTLAENLKRNITFIHLDLSGNYIEDEGSIALADVLQTNTTITYIDLHDNLIGDKGAETLAKVLKFNTTITFLNLWNNKIENTGAIALAEALKINTSLIHLNLGDNNIKNEGLKALANNIQNNHSLIIIKIYDNPSSNQSYANTIESITKRNKGNFIKIANNLLKHKDIILSNFSKVSEWPVEKSNNLHSAINKSLLLPPIEQLPIFEDTDIVRYIYNEDTNKLVKNVDIFVNNNLFYRSLVCKNFTIGKQGKEKITIPPEIVGKIASWMTGKDKFYLLTNTKFQNNTLSDTQTEITNHNESLQIDCHTDNDSTSETENVEIAGDIMKCIML